MKRTMKGKKMPFHEEIKAQGNCAKTTAKKIPEYDFPQRLGKVRDHINDMIQKVAVIDEFLSGPVPPVPEGEDCKPVDSPSGLLDISAMAIHGINERLNVLGSGLTSLEETLHK